jgi:hypothetical protein
MNGPSTQQFVELLFMTRAEGKKNGGETGRHQPAGAGAGEPRPGSFGGAGLGGFSGRKDFSK